MSDHGVSIKDAFPFWCMSVSRLQTFIVVSKFLLSLVLNLSFASLFVHSGRLESRTNQGIITSKPM